MLLIWCSRSASAPLGGAVCYGKASGSSMILSPWRRVTRKTLIRHYNPRTMIWLQLLKTAHIISAAIIFGTGLGIAFFTWFGYRAAMRTRSMEALRALLKLTV